jgi:hypothetical protein
MVTRTKGQGAREQLMGIGDSIEKAAENAVEDLAGTSGQTDDAHVPEPGAPNEPIRVHSSISEGSNAADDTDQASRRHGSGNLQSPPPDRDEKKGTAGDGGKTGKSAAAEADSEVPDVPRGVPGPAGLPNPDPDALRADPSEADEDPSTELGRS